MAGGLGFYTRVCCEIDNMPTWAKAAIGTTGIIIAGASGVGAAAIAEAVIASAGISAVTDGAFYTVASLRNGSFSRSELKDTVINGAANGYMFAGAGLGVAGIRNAAKSGKIAGFMADEAGSVAYERGKTSVKTDFYVKPNGEIVPATGYRYMPAEASYMDSLKNTMEIPANPSGTYITFDKFDVPTPSRLQVPHDASIRGSFDTLQIIDDIRVPNGKWGQASWLEPITKDFPKYGHGGATQALTYQKIKLNSLKDLSR